MIPSDRRPGSEAPVAAVEDGRSRRETLRPPEWMSPGSAGLAHATSTLRSLERYTGPRADEAWMRARTEEARSAGDAAGLRSACATLARWLGSRDRDLDEAVDLAGTALSIGEDVELRRQLSAWLESLGEPARAAGVLEVTASTAHADLAEAGYVLLRGGVLYARAGATAKAAEAFKAAAVVNSADPLPAELLGALSRGQPDVVPSTVGAEAYVQAARRQSARSEIQEELEDLWRAFAIDVTSDATIPALAEALERLGRVAAADEVWRAHAGALAAAEPERAARVHAYRRAWALVAQEPVHALGTALDERLEASLDGEAGRVLDALLLDVGMLEAVAARLEVRAERAQPGTERAALLVELGRLCMGPLANDTRAVAAYAAALAEDPTNEDARAGLRGTPARPAGAPADDGADSAPAMARAWVRASLAGDRRGQALALERIAASSSASLRAVLLSVAAERHLASGDAGAARLAAEGATQADPASVRAIATLAEAVLDARDRSAATALERAIALAGPRASWCSALADALHELAEPALAAEWLQRCVSLCPGDREAIEKLLDRLVRAGDADRIGDALAWLLSQPQPADWLEKPFAGALGELSRLDPERAAVVARRALDVLGPRLPRLREAMSAAAARASDQAFEVALLERWLAAGPEGEQRSELFARLADLRRAAGDGEGESRIVARAIRERAAPPDLDVRLERLGAPRSTSDALLWLKRARAERLAAGEDRDAEALAWRELGAARWDLADDRAGAVAAWRRAARAAPSGGYATLAVDLISFAGPPFAVERLSRLVDAELDDARAAAMAADMARAALAIGEARSAFDLASRGVARTPSAPEALEVAEQAARASGDPGAASALYELIAGRSLGRFGRRAAHHRGARFFERCGEHGLALKHASQAFFAVPSEGASFNLLERAAVRAGDRTQAVRMIELVAERTRPSEARAAWLMRAASIAGEGEEGARRKVDALLGAVAASPSAVAIALLRDAARELLRFGPEEREVVEMRLRRAALAITERLGGPQGARAALAFAATALELFGDGETAFALIERAFSCDADVDEFSELAAQGPALALAPRARERVAAMLGASQEALAKGGAPVLRLLGAIAAAAGDSTLQARANAEASKHDPESDSLAKPVEAEGERNDRDVGVELDSRAADAADAADSAAERSLESDGRVRPVPFGDAASPANRADRWVEIAERREARGDQLGAVRAHLEACNLDSEQVERWSSLERVADAAGDHGARVEALEQISRRVAPEGRAAVLRRLARANERKSDVGAAEDAWQRVLAADPADEEADFAIESLIVARGRYDQLAEHLARRVERLGAQPAQREMLRAVRLRRAAILEQRLSRLEDASEELEALLREWPDNCGALRYLADLLERRGDPRGAAPLWARAASVEVDLGERDELELRAAKAWRASGNLASAREHVNRVVGRNPANRRALDLRVEVARALGADSELGDALDDSGSADDVEPNVRSELLTEAAQAAARCGDGLLALERARRAADAAPKRAASQLLARTLEYRLRGAGVPDEAAKTLENLGRIGELLGRDDAALRAFLLAAALDVANGQGAGLAELEATRATFGDHPLLALARAERLAARGQAEASVDEYRLAFEGRFAELRDPGKVALEATDAALRAGRLVDAAHFLAIAQRHETEVPGVRARQTLLEESQAAAAACPAVGGDDRGLPELEAAVAGAAPADRAKASLALARARVVQGDTGGAELLLWEALAGGLPEAGDVLADLLARSRDRAPELVRVRRQQAAMEPGDIGRLQALRAAALADDDLVYGRAIEHILRAFDPGARFLDPPPLATQIEHAGILALLTRPSLDAAGESLAGLWEGASQLFVRDAPSYGITGVERVVPGPTSAITRLYEAAMRLLDVPRIPLFVARSRPGPPSAHAALLSPPSVVLSGDVREETAELRFALGCGISAALLQNVLRLGLPSADGRALIAALGAAFGPPESSRPSDARIARLAESFWQMVPAGIQRRLQYLLGGGALAPYEELVSRAEQSGLRVGLFLAGDIACAARALIARGALSADRAELALTDLRSMCEESPALADLFRLAASPEYADARWQTVAPASGRGNLSMGRFSLL